MKQIHVTVAADGGVTIETTGFKGKSCELVTADLEKALGVPQRRKRKPEYHVADLAAQQKAGGGR